MEYLRQTIDSNKLSVVFDLPISLRDRKVDVIILPAESDTSLRTVSQSGSAFGCLSKYANAALVPHEEGAWAQAVVMKHADR